MQLTEKQLQILTAEGHLLVTGGPGSGKTTVAILKAADATAHTLRAEQKALFLSFARATVSRVLQAIEFEHEIAGPVRRRIEVDTYHSFFWRILKTHGYLVGLPRRLSILTPAAEATALSAIRSSYPPESKLTDAEKAEKAQRERSERERLAVEDGRVCFDLFARYVGDVLHGAGRVRQLVSTIYPIIVLDEFQDTDAEQWRVVQALGEHSTLFALADPEQRIYDFIGADPERLDHFKTAFTPTEIDLSTDNHRSPGTDIAAFGNDILAGRFRQKTYSGIAVSGYDAGADPAMTTLVTTTYAARKRLLDAGVKGWSVAVLVPTKRMTRFVSDSFRSPPAGLTAIPHTAAVELEAAILGAEIIAFLMQPDLDGTHFERFVDLLRNYFQGKGGGTPSQGDIKEAQAIVSAYDDWRTRGAVGKEIKKNSILVAVRAVYAAARDVVLTGDPDRDWRELRKVLEDGACPRLRNVAQEVRNVRLLERGTQLRQQLSQDWRDNRAYANALAITQQAFVQEHFATNLRPESGIVVMNMHKAKGKQFDEVIIFESWPRIAKGRIVANFDRIARGNARENCDVQTRQNFRVSITRGKRQTTILTPRADPCVLLLPQ